jgi:CheY-like chemotaxis protein
MPGHALIIEDELVVGLDLQDQLMALGYDSFAFAATEGQALEQARLACPDLITADVGLLSGDGALAVEAILAECGPTPVVYISGDRARLDRLVGKTTVEKPVTPYRLAQAVHQAAAG